MSRNKYAHSAPLALAISSALAVGTTQAAVITVDTNADPGSSEACSLRSAIESVNTQAAVAGCPDPSDGNLDTINFDASVTGSIDLTEGMLTISESVVVSGPGAGVLSIDAGGNSRVLRTTGGTVEISGLTLTGGGNNNYGGGVLVDVTSQVTLSDCVISGNHADQYGGGITHNSPSLKIEYCTISNNSSNGYGGGVAVYAGKTEIENAIITDNDAGHMGGGLWVSGIFFSDEGPEIRSDNGEDNHSRGAGYYDTVQAILHIESSIISGNDAMTGGGVAAGQMEATGTASRDGGLFSHSSSSDDPDLRGGLFPSFGPNLVIIDSEISTNDGELGGGIGAWGYYVSDDDPIALERGIYQSYGRYNLIEIYQTSINGNIAEDSGGGIIQKYTESLIYDSDIIGNSATNAGGGIFNAGNEMDSGNLSAQYERGMGGGDFKYLGLVDSTVSNNELTPPAEPNGDPTPLGAGIFNGLGQTLLRRSEVSSNVGADFGGGLASLGGATYILDTSLSNNEGGGLLSNYESGTGIFYSRVEGNTDPGGIVCEGDSFCLAKYSSITHNQGEVVGGVANNMGLMGGGLLSLPESSLETRGGAFGQFYLFNSTVSSNQGYIGGIAGPQTYLYHATVAMNQQVSGSAAVQSRGIPGTGGALLDDTNSIIEHTIIAGNSADGGPANDLVVVGSDPITMNYSLIQDDSGFTASGSGNILGQDPLLGPLDFNGSDFSMTHALLEGSPAIDAGDPDLSTNLDYDQRMTGFPRVFGGVIDIGAFEFSIDEIFADRFESSP